MTKPLSLALLEILGPKDNWVTTLTFLGHDLDLSRSRYVIGHVTIRLPIPLFLLAPLCDQAPISTPFEILGPKDNWVTTLTFLGHVTSSVM